MNIMPSISILTVAGAAIGILAILLWYVSREVRLEQAALVKARFAQLHESQLEAYEKARIDCYLSEVNTGRMTLEEAQRAASADRAAIHWTAIPWQGS